MGIYLSPGVYAQTMDLTQRVQSVSTSTASMVFAAPKGTTKIKLTTNGNVWVGEYGDSDPSLGYGADTAKAFLKQSGSLLNRRVVGTGATKACLTYYNVGGSYAGLSGTWGANYFRTLRKTWPSAMLLGEEGGGRNLIQFGLTSALLAGDSINVVFTDGNNSASPSATAYATSSNNTLLNFANTVKTALNSFYNMSGDAGVQVEVVNETDYGVTDPSNNKNRFVNVWLPENEEGLVTTLFSVTKLPATITAIARSSNTVTVTTSSAHTWTAGQKVTIDGVTDLTFNGTFTLLTASGSSATWTQVAADATSSAGTAKIVAQTAVIMDKSKLFDVFHKDFGDEGNAYGTKIVNLDAGRRQVQEITFSGKFVTGDTISGVVDGVAWGPVTAVANSDDTMILIQDEILDKMGLAITATDIVSVVDPTNMSRYIAGRSTYKFGSEKMRKIRVLSKSTLESMVLGAPTATRLSGSPVVGTVVETVAFDPYDGSFELQVFNKSNTKLPIESTRCALNDWVDGTGNQLYIEDAINFGASPSKYIRVAVPSYIKATKKTKVAMKSFVNGTTKTNDVDREMMAMTGGTDGAAPTTAEIRTGWNDFRNRERIPVRIALNGGSTTEIEVQQHITDVAETRRDAIAILDMPSVMQETLLSIEYVNEMLNINSSYAAIYTSDLRIADDKTAIRRYVPNSGYVGAVYARTDRERALWFAPAGLNRGIIPNVIDLRFNYDKDMMDLMDPNHINCIIDKYQKGVTVYGENTLQSKTSGLSDVHVRRLLNYIEVILVDALDYSVWEPQDSQLRYGVTQLVNNALKPIKSDRGLEEYLTLCNDDNNGPEVREADRLNVDVYLKAVGVAKIIRLLSVLTPKTASFTEAMTYGVAAANA